MTMRKFGSVKIPVMVPMEGAELRRPLVTNWSVAAPGITLAAVLPGKAPNGLAAEAGTVKEGDEPPEATMEPLPLALNCPRYQSKPSALLSSCATSIKRALI